MPLTDLSSLFWVLYVPVYAMSGGTLIARAADEIVLGEFSVLGPIDPQIAGLPAASIVKARESKSIAGVFDLTLVLADVAEKALAQVKRGAVGMDQAAVLALADKLAGGHWTHDYALTASEAALGLPVKVRMPPEVMELMSLYPLPIQQSWSRVYADRHSASKARLNCDGRRHLTLGAHAYTCISAGPFGRTDVRGALRLLVNKYEQFQ
jgi:ClpP class serine protease